MNPPSLQLEPTKIPPSDPGNSGGHNSQNSNETVTFRQVLRHWCGIGTNDHQNIASSTLFQIWFTQNVYPLVTPKRIFYFSLSQISFFLAYGFFTQTELYKSYISGGEDHDHGVLQQARPLLFLAAAFGAHTVCLIFLFFFSFCCYVAFERCRWHPLVKSLIFMLWVSLLIMVGMGIGEEHLHDAAAPSATPTTSSVINVNDSKVDYSKVAGLAACGLLTIDALSIINLLNPAGHHYALLEATATLTLHVGLAGRIYFGIPATVFVDLVILVIKNFLCRDIGHAQLASTNERHPVAWVAPEVV